MLRITSVIEGYRPRGIGALLALFQSEVSSSGIVVSKVVEVIDLDVAEVVVYVTVKEGRADEW